MALVLDNCCADDSDMADLRGQVSIIPLPPNCTALHQPIDLGIIAEFKLGYKKYLLTGILFNFETREEHRAAATKLPRGMQGLIDGYDPDVLDACKSRRVRIT